VATQPKTHAKNVNHGMPRSRRANTGVQVVTVEGGQADLSKVQSAIANPQNSSPVDIQALQRTVGNRATSKLIQPKLTVGPAGDKYEQEADNVARQVLSSAATNQSAPVQHSKDDELGLRAKPLVQRASSAAGFEAGEAIEGRLQTLKGNGAPLPDTTRGQMESSFGADFGAVRVHTNNESAQLNRSLQAQAFTHGSDIYFGEDTYKPNQDSGKQLLAHELTHVVQQGAAPSTPSVSRKMANVSEGDVHDSRLQLARGKAGRVMGSLGSSPLGFLAAPFAPLIGAGAGAYYGAKAAHKKTGSKIGGFFGGLLGLLGGAVAGTIGAALLPILSAVPGLLGGLSSSLAFGFKGGRQKEAEEPAGQLPYNHVPIEITTDTYVLRGRRYNPKLQYRNGPSAGKAVILFSGSGGPNENQLEPLARHYTKQGATAFAINYRGFGESRDRSRNRQGEFTESSPFMSEQGLVEDAVRIYTYVTGQGFAAGNIVLHGFSLGGAIAAKLAKRLARQGVQLGGLVLHSSIKTAYEAGKGGIGLPVLGHIGGLITKLSAGSFDTTQSLEEIQQHDPNLPIHFMSGQKDAGDQLALGETNLQDSANGNVSSYEGRGTHLSEQTQTSEHLTPRQKDFLATLVARGRNRDVQNPEEVQSVNN
jgi:dienelactone hydrolase